jgi:hypothetical protein
MMHTALWYIANRAADIGEARRIAAEALEGYIDYSKLLPRPPSDA